MSTRNDRTEPRRVRARRVVAGVLAALTLAVAPSAVATPPNTDARGHVNPVVDVLLLRPAGIAAAAGGVGLFVIAAPIVLITRPHEIGRPFEWLVMGPIRYTWMDPIGDHAQPDR